MENQAAATVFAVAGAVSSFFETSDRTLESEILTKQVCWSIQLIPQIIVNYRRHHARGNSVPAMVQKSFRVGH
jgi:hypothetical protein